MSSQNHNGSLYTNTKNNIAYIEFGHPAGNSFTSNLLNRLTNAIAQISQNKEVHVVILKAKGDRAFCAGASFNELLAVTNPQQGKAFFSGFAKVINAMRKCPKPIIARVHGKIVGGGVGLVAACDYVYATEAAALKLSELAIGIGPFVIAPAVERKIGKAALAALAFNPTQWQNAYWAKDNGLYTKVYDTINELDKALDIHSSQLASYNQEALAAMKSILWQNTQHWDTLLLERAQLSGNLVCSPNTKAILKKINA